MKSRCATSEQTNCPTHRWTRARSCHDPNESLQKTPLVAVLTCGCVLGTPWHALARLGTALSPAATQTGRFRQAADRTWANFMRQWLTGKADRVERPRIAEIARPFKAVDNMNFLCVDLRVDFMYLHYEKDQQLETQSRQYRLNKRGVIVGGEGGEDEELRSETAGSRKVSLDVPAITIIQPPTSNGDVQSGDEREPEDELTEEAVAFEKHRKNYIEIIRTLRRKYPDALMEEIEAMAREEILNKGPKSRAYYRIQATRKLMGAGQLMRRRPSRMVLEELRDRKSRAFSKDEMELGIPRTDQDEPPTVKIYFDPGHITCMESCGELQAVVVRDATNVESTVCVDYKTEDGTACAGPDYEHVEGTLIFRPGEREKTISITIIDDEVFEEDEHFYI
ncbi:sodium/calcium exchanger 1-like, partial [Tropilaelaps mercedesae]